MDQFGIYIHIPYCLQRCIYCDFTTFEFNKIMPPEQYVEYLKKEIQTRSRFVPFKSLTSIYFGGGTPSLIDADHIVSILQELNNAGFETNENTEVTIEINPATVSKDNLQTYLQAGINRFSVGAQSFDNELLKACGRRHNADDTVNTLELLKDYNYSFDLLFALPNQSLQQLQRDLDLVNKYKPPHLSAYCLTVPEGHPMSYHRPEEEAQVEMFHLIENELKKSGLLKYEISNFARPGYESKHNMLYWTYNNFWGLGLSAHSFFNVPDYGTRFWNPKKFDDYTDQINSDLLISQLPSSQKEHLKTHEALTDFIHTHLRTTRGMNIVQLKNMFPDQNDQVIGRLKKLKKDDLICSDSNNFKLTSKGFLLSNFVFEYMAFFEDCI
ncbi:MAG: radical SAM family heme chaperone HemW [Bdellovibrionales bacterium]|nr:radical SAM family heme chaperone HemW [Bdellovibrionales bacterium]